MSVGLLGDRTISLASTLSADEKIARIADEQRLCVSRRQLLRAGLDRRQIDRRIGSSGLRRIHPEVFAVASLGDTPLAAESAALLSCTARAMLSQHSATVLYRVRPGVARPIHVTVPEGLHHRLRGGDVIVHRSAILTPDDRWIVDGLPVTSPARTFLDLAASDLTDRDLERLLARAIFSQRIVTRGEINRLLRRAGRHRGAATLDRVLARADRNSDTDSPPEEAMLALIRQSGLPEPEQHAWVLDFNVDFLWPELRLCVEVDAYGTHSSRHSFERDRRQDDTLFTRLGIATLRPTGERIAREPIAVVGDLVRAAERQRAATGALTTPPERRVQ